MPEVAEKVIADPMVAFDQEDLVVAEPEIEEEESTVNQLTVDETPAETPVETAPEVKADAPTHSQETLTNAAQLGISPTEIAEMTPAELKRTVSHMTRGMQQVWDKFQTKPAEKTEEAKPAPEEAWLKNLDDLLPEVKEPIQHLITKSKEIDSLKAQIAKLEEANVKTQGDGIRARLQPMLTAIDPALTTALSEAKEWGGFMKAMQKVAEFEEASGNHLDEPTRVQRAVAMMGRTPAPKAAAPKEDAKKAAFEKHKEEYDGGALGTPRNRKPASDLESMVNEKLGAIQKKYPTKAPDDIGTAFTPLDG
jgi:hypothetical protein